MQQFSWHPVLMIVALVLVYGNGMLIFRLLRCQPKPRVKLVHASLNGLALILSIVALFAAFSFDIKNDAPTLNSLHSWIGLGTVILFATNMLVGAVFFLLPQAPGRLRATVLPLHAYAGQATLLLMVASVVSGIKKEKMLSLEACIINAVAISVILSGLIAGYAVTRPEYQRRVLAEESPDVSVTGSHE